MCHMTRKKTNEHLHRALERSLRPFLAPGCSAPEHQGARKCLGPRLISRCARTMHSAVHRWALWFIAFCSNAEGIAHWQKVLSEDMYIAVTLDH